jgi:hypothetical protein
MKVTLMGVEPWTDYGWIVWDQLIFINLWYTLWLFNIAMENGPFIDGLPVKIGDFP